MATAQMSSDQFASNMSEYIKKIAPNENPSQLTNCVVSHIKQELIHPYYSITSNCSDIESPAAIGTLRFVSSSTLLRHSLKLKKLPLILTKTEDLKQIAFSPVGTPIVLQTDDLNSLSIEAIEKLIVLAKQKRINVSIILRKEVSVDPKTELLSKKVLSLAQESGGVVVSL
jgi:hypothetical protein